MYAFLLSTGLVALAEMGDKTQLLALLLAARYRRPLPILIAILLATLFNHALAAALGAWLAAFLNAEVLRWILVVSFIGMAAWMLIPDQLDDEQEGINRWQRFGVFGATFVLFFLAEIGDKTQLATIALAARFDQLLAVLAGTTLGMMLANAPAVFIGDRLAEKLPVRLIHRITALLFLLIGLGAMLQPYFST